VLIKSKAGVQTADGKGVTPAHTSATRGYHLLLIALKKKKAAEEHKKN
jgi:hypothetical protein